MRYFLLIFIISITSFSFADTVLIRKSDGYPIEYQNGDVSKEILLENNPSYQEDEVELKKVTVQEYQNIFKEKVLNPEKEARKKEVDKKKNRIKQKLGLTDNDLDDLKEALND